MTGPRPTNWAADLWEELRKQGLSPEQATQEVHTRLAQSEPQQVQPDQPTGQPAPGDDWVAGARAFGQGATLGFGDEIEAGVRSLGPETYGGALQEIRDKQKGYRSRHPIANAVTELAGGALPALATGGVGMVKAGVGMGAVAGAGSAEGGLRDRAAGAGLGAVTGGVLGAAIPAGARLVKGAADVLGTRGASGVAKRADELLLQGLERDQQKPTDILAAFKARQSSKPETLADLAGQNTRGIARQAQATPSKAKEGIYTAFEERAANQPERIAQDLETGIGLPRQDSGALVENLIQQRSLKAEPLYQKAYQHGVVNDPRITEMLELPWFKEAWSRGRRLALAEGRQLPEQVTPDVQSLDYVKRGLDDYLQSGMGKEGGLGPAERRAVRKLKNEMLEHLDKAVPDYAAARAQYAGDSALRDAVEEGGNILRADPRQVARDMAKLSPSERDMYRVGALDAVRGKMDAANDGRDLTKVIFGNDKIREQLRPLFPTPQAYQTFAAEMEREGTMATTRNAVGHGSPTARIQAEMADAGGMAPQALAQVATGNIPGAVTTGIVGALSRRARGVSGEVADALSTSFQAGTKNPADLEQLLTRLGVAGQRRAGNQMAKATTTKAVAAKTGLSTGREWAAEQLPKAAETVPPDQQKHPNESPDDYAMRLKRSGVPEQVARAYFAAQGL